MDPNTGMPLNIVSPPPLGAKSSSPMDVASANMNASTAKMSMLLNATHGGGKNHRRNSLKGGAASGLVVQPLHVPYPGGEALQEINKQMTTIGAQNVANSKYDTAWLKTGGKRSGSNKRSSRSGSKRSSRSGSNKRSGRRRTIKRSSRRYKKM